MADWSKWGQWKAFNNKRRPSGAGTVSHARRERRRQQALAREAAEVALKKEEEEKSKLHQRTKQSKIKEEQEDTLDKGARGSKDAADPKAEEKDALDKRAEEQKDCAQEEEILNTESMKEGAIQHDAFDTKAERKIGVAKAEEAIDTMLEGKKRQENGEGHP